MDEPPEPPIDEPPASGSVAPSRAARSPKPLLSAGWGDAVVGAAVAFAVPVLAGEALGLVLALASSPPRPSGLAFAKLGALFFYAFVHVPLVVTFEAGNLGGLAGTGFEAATGVLSITPLAGTALVLWLLGRAGRRVALGAGVTTLDRAVQGAKVALPFAVVSGLAGLALSVSVPVAGGLVSVAPSAVGAFVWPAILALVAGAVGGARSGAARGPWLRAGRDGLRTLGLASFLAVVGLVLLAPVNPRSAGAYFDAFHSGLAAGVSRVALTLAVLPNMALWVLFPSMGGCLRLSTEQAGGGVSVCLLSYSQFPPAGGLAAVAQRAPGFDLPPPPSPYLAFVLVPLIAALAGGWLAANGRAREGRRRAAVGAAAGLAFALASVAFGFLSGIRVEVSGSTGGVPQTVAAVLGPELLVGALVALAWGVAGGVAGALARGRRRRPAGTGDPEPPPPL